MKQYNIITSSGEQLVMDEKTLLTAYMQGIYAPDTMVWTEGMADWQPIKSVFGMVQNTAKKAVRTTTAGAPTTAARGKTTLGARGKLVAGGSIQTALTAPSTPREPKKSKAWIVWVSILGVLLAAFLVYWFGFRAPNITSDKGLVDFVNDRMEKVRNSDMYRKLDKDLRKGLNDVVKNVDDIMDGSSGSSGDKRDLMQILTAMGNESAISQIIKDSDFQDVLEKNIGSLMSVAAATGNKDMIRFLKKEADVTYDDEKVERSLKEGALAGGQKDICQFLISECNLRFNIEDLKNIMTIREKNLEFILCLRLLNNPGLESSKKQQEQDVADALQFVLDYGMNGDPIDQDELEEAVERCQSPKLKKVMENFMPKGGKSSKDSKSSKGGKGRRR